MRDRRAPLGLHRGNEWPLRVIGGRLEVALVRAPIARVAEAIVRQPGGPTGRAFLSQICEHPWTILCASDQGLAEALTRDLSEELSTRAIAYGYEDVSGTVYYRLFDGGEAIEEFRAGPDDSEEYVELAEELGEEVDIEAMRSEGKLGGPFFRSRLRRVDVGTIGHADPFIDAFFRDHDAYLPRRWYQGLPGQEEELSRLGYECRDA
jgi:hypothetical protein